MDLVNIYALDWDQVDADDCAGEESSDEAHVFAARASTNWSDMGDDTEIIPCVDYLKYGDGTTNFKMPLGEHRGNKY